MPRGWLLDFREFGLVLDLIGYFEEALLGQMLYEVGNFFVCLFAAFSLDPMHDGPILSNQVIFLLTEWHYRPSR